MSQDSFSTIGFFEDFLFVGDDGGVALVDATPQVYNNILVTSISGVVTIDSTVDEPGGVASFSGAGGAEDGVALMSAPYKPADGTIVMGCRFKLSVLTTWRAFIGFAETVDRDETVPPFSLSGTTLTDNDAGQCFGLYYDTAATTDDWRAAGSSDGTIFTTCAPLGVRANSTPVADQWIIVRVEIDPTGAARAYLGDSSVDPAGTQLKLVYTLPAGNLDTTASYLPLVVLTDPSTTDPTWEVDYFWARGSRDWTV